MTERRCTELLGECWHDDTPTENGRCPICDKGLAAQRKEGVMVEPIEDLLLRIADILYFFGKLEEGNRLRKLSVWLRGQQIPENI